MLIIAAVINNKYSNTSIICSHRHEIIPYGQNYDFCIVAILSVIMPS